MGNIWLLFIISSGHTACAPLEHSPPPIPSNQSGIVEVEVAPPKLQRQSEDENDNFLQKTFFHFQRIFFFESRASLIFWVNYSVSQYAIEKPKNVFCKVSKCSSLLRNLKRSERPKYSPPLNKSQRALKDNKKLLCTQTT